MVSTRVLPERHNPLLAPTESTAVEMLVERRRLGTTFLTVKAGIAGVTNATKTDNMGAFDYAHLRVPLPKDLTGSGIFKLTRNTSFPESYFLMRRSSDGLVSSTGMFKAAFPWASLAEEEVERKFHKIFPGADPEEIAGSVWITPEEALTLSDEYSMRHWVEALLDPAPIEKGNKDKHDVPIHAPPKFDIRSAVPALLPPQSETNLGSARLTRSASPSKLTTPRRRIATPRKARATRNGTKADLLKDDIFSSSMTSTPGSALQREIQDGATPLRTNAEANDSGDDEVKAGNVRIEVAETVVSSADTQTTTTNVKIDVPHSHPELPEPEDPTAMIEEAKRMVQIAHELDGAGSKNIQTKRKIEEVVEEEELMVAGRPTKLARKIYTTEQKLIKEKVTRRAAVGLVVMGALAGALQYFV